MELLSIRDYFLLGVCFLFGALSLDAQPFCPIKSNKKWGLVDTTGNIVVKAEFDAIGSFGKYGYALVQKNNKAGILDRNGKIVLSPLFDEIAVIDSLLFSVREGDDWKVRLIDGKLLLLGTYTQLQNVRNKYILFKSNGFWSINDWSGNTITTVAYDSIRSLPNDYFVVFKDGKAGLLDSIGQSIFHTEVDDIQYFNKNYYFFRKEKKWAIWELNNNYRTDFNYQNFTGINEDYIVLYQNRLLQLFSIAASKSISELGEYSNFKIFNKDFLICQKGEYIGLINNQGKLILPIEYDEILELTEGVFRVNKNNKWGVASYGGKNILNIEYDFIAPLRDGLSIIKKNNITGAINKFGSLVIPLDYDKIEVSKTQIRAFQKNTLQLYYFDDEGNITSDNKFEKYIKIKISPNQNTSIDLFNMGLDDAPLMLDSFEWYYSFKKNKWGLRRLDNGKDQIKPTFDTIRINKDLGFTLVGLDTHIEQKYEWTNWNFYRIYGLVNNEKGLLVSDMNIFDLRIDDFYKQLPAARFIASDGRHGLMTKRGKILLKSYAYIGEFKNGLARFSIKGKLTGSISQRKYALETINEYLKKMIVPNEMGDYTLHDREFRNDGVLLCNDCVWGFMDSLGRPIVQPQYHFVSDFVKNVAIVEKDSLWGVIDTASNVLIPCNYDSIGFLQNTYNEMLVLGKNHIRYGLFDTSGLLIVPMVYEKIGNNCEGRFAVKRDGLWGFTDEQGNEIIACQYKKVNDFSEGLAAVLKGSKWGFIDLQGNSVIDFIYKETGNFKNGLAWISTGFKYGYINNKGGLIIEEKFEKAFDFEGDIARVKENNKFGLIQNNGDYILKPKYLQIDSFNNNGLAIVKFQSEPIRYGVIDKNGDLLTNIDYKMIQPFKEGFALVKTNRGYGFINQFGKMIVDDIYANALDFSDGMAGVERQGQWGYIDTLGKEIIKPEFTKCLDFREGRAVVYKGYRKSGVIDKQGNYIIEPIINRVIQYSDGRALVSNNGTYHFIDEHTNSDAMYFQFARSYNNGIAPVQIGEKWGLNNIHGIALVMPKYDYIDSYRNGYAKARLNAFSGLANLKGDVLLSPEYENITYIGNNLFRVEKGNAIGYLHNSGKWIWEMQE